MLRHAINGGAFWSLVILSVVTSTAIAILRSFGAIECAWWLTFIPFIAWATFETLIFVLILISAIAVGIAMVLEDYHW